MGVATTLYAIGDAIDPSLSYWSVLLRSGKTWSERQLIPTWTAGQRGLRKLDWALDLISTGDIYRVKEITLHCPDGRPAVLEVTEDGTVFQFKTKSMNMLGASDTALEFQCIGRVLDKVTGRCECFIWDYHPAPGQPNLVAYKSNIYRFGAHRDNLTPLGALSIDVQGFRL